MKILWTGSDILYITLRALKHSKKSKWFYMICFSLFARIIEPFIESHYVVHKDMIRDLRKFKMKKDIKVLVDPASTRKYEKHESFNVLFYNKIGSRKQFKIMSMYMRRIEQRNDMQHCFMSTLFRITVRDGYQ